MLGFSLMSDSRHRRQTRPHFPAPRKDSPSQAFFSKYILLCSSIIDRKECKGRRSISDSVNVVVQITRKQTNEHILLYAACSYANRAHRMRTPIQSNVMPSAFTYNAIRMTLSESHRFITVPSARMASINSEYEIAPYALCVLARIINHIRRFCRNISNNVDRCSSGHNSIAVVLFYSIFIFFSIKCCSLLCTVKQKWKICVQ